MATATELTGAIRRLGTCSEDLAGDPELLDHYARGRDQTAFAALVRRYGALVLGVARRQLADRHRAEDVFQATFLALARSAPKLGGRPVLASWLYTVALRQARKARAQTVRRDALERAAPARPEGGGDPLAEITGRELLQTIDDELARLPDRLRLPVLLCCVQGLSRDEAARRLGWSDGALKGRLERGRRKLAARLAARGLAPSAVFLAPLAAVAVPADLLARAAEQAAAPWAKTVPSAVAALAATTAGRSLVPLALAGCVLAGVIGAAFALGGSPRVEPLAPPPAATPPPAAKAAEPEVDDPLPTGAALRFGSPRYRHPTAIESLAVSPDGTFAVASSGGRINGAVRAYDLATGRVRFAITHELGEGYIEGVAISPDGKTVATKRNFSVFLHDAGTGKQTARIQYPSANPYTTADLIHFAPDGKRVVVLAAEGKALHLIDVAKAEVARTFEHAHVVFAAAFSPDGKRLVGGGYDSEKGAYFARLWDVETGKELHRLAFGGGIRCVAYSPDGATIAVGGDGGKALEVKLFDAATGKERLKIPFPGASSVKSVAFSPDGGTLAASGGSATRLFDTTTGEERVQIDRKAIGLRFSPDGKSLTGAVAATVYRWSTTGRSLIPDGGDSPVAQVEVTADGKRLVTRGQDGDAHVWDARTDEHLRRVGVTWQRGLAVSPDGRFLVWPAADEKIQFKDANQPNLTFTRSRLRMLDLTTGKPVARFDGFEGDAYDLSFTAGGKTLVTVDHRDGAVRFWDAATGKVERSFAVGEKGQQYRVWRTRLSPDGKVLAAAYHPSGRGLFGGFAVKLWDTATGKELHDLAGHQNYLQALAFSPDGKFLVTASEPLGQFAQEQLKLPADQVFVWDVATGKRVGQLPVGGTAAAFAPDGKAVAVAEPDGTIRLWDAATWKVGGEFRGPRERVTALTFGPGGELYSGAADATVTAWDLRLAKPAERK